MAWERRQRGGRYYYRSVRRGGRVVKEYLGCGPAAELLADLDAQERQRRRQERDAERRSRKQRAEAQAPLEEFILGVEALTRAALMEAGYHQHDRGEWRRRRER